MTFADEIRFVIDPLYAQALAITKMQPDGEQKSYLWEWEGRTYIMFYSNSPEQQLLHRLVVRKGNRTVEITFRQATEGLPVFTLDGEPLTDRGDLIQLREKLRSFRSDLEMHTVVEVRPAPEPTTRGEKIDLL